MRKHVHVHCYHHGLYVIVLSLSRGCIDIWPETVLVLSHMSACRRRCGRASAPGSAA